jgi:hypothetical protein
MADEDSGEGKRQMGVNMTHRFLKRLNESRQTMKTLITAVLILLMLGMAQAESRQSKERNHNYILRRQEAGLVTSVPTIRRIYGKREIDVYRNGLMFEGDHVVGVRPR